MDWLTCLQATPKRFLVGMAITHGLKDVRHAPKDRLTQHLVTSLAEPTRLASRLTALPLDQQRGLRALADAHGQLPFTNFRALFGEVRPYGTLRYSGPRDPWRSPVSTAEALLYQGLIFLLSPKTSGETTATVMLPDELLAQLGTPRADDHLPPPPAPLSHPDSIVADLTLFLAYLQANEVLPYHGRWLSLRHCRTLDACLLIPTLPPLARSELDSGRLAFLHFLAEALDLAHLIHGRLKPSVTALDWLRQPAPAQLHQAWSAWLSAASGDGTLWRRFRLPGHALRSPQHLARRILHRLAAYPNALPITVDSLLRDPAPLDEALLPWWEREIAGQLAALILDLLAGPLTWLGVLSEIPAEPPARAWRRSAWGDWLLGPRPSPPNSSPRQPLALLPDLTLAVAASSHPDGILAVAPWTELAPGPALRLTPASLAAARAGGATLPDLFATLAAHATPPVDSDQRAALAEWAKPRGATVRPAWIVDFSSQTQLDALGTDRRTRSLLRRRLAPTSALVQPADLDPLLRQLSRRGLAVDLAAPFADCGLNPSSAGSAGDAAWPAVALLVYSALARRLPALPVPPAAALDALRPALAPAHWAAAQAAAAQAIAAVEAAFDDPPAAPADQGIDELIDRLTLAIHAGQPLALCYWSPWTQQATERVVHPRHVEWRGDHPYLVAFCDLRQQDRSFRLDRILAARAIPTSSDSAAPPLG